MKVTKKAFTLIELLIVIAIIGILATVIFVSLNAARKKAQDAQIKSDMTSMSQALEVVKIDRNLANVAWSAVVKDATAGDNNMNRWTDSGDPATGNLLMAKLPAHPISGQVYRIRIVNGSSYALLARLNTTNSYFCNINGTASVLTNQATLVAAQTSCTPN